MSADDGFSRPGAGQPHYRDFRGTSFCVDYPKSKKGQAVLPLGFSNQPTRPQPKWRDFLSVGLANERAKKARLSSQGPLVALS